MSLKSGEFASSGRRRRGIVAATLVFAGLYACGSASAAGVQQGKPDRRAVIRLDEANRREGEAVLALADAAMAGRAVVSDFGIGWRNDFFKAQPGTFVPFTITIDRARVKAPAALLYVRAAARNAAAPRAKGEPQRFAFDAIFPVELAAPAGQPIRIIRGFAVPAGVYDVYIVVRERPADPFAETKGLKAAVLKQPLTVPDFWTGELAASTVMLANRIQTLAAPIAPDDLLEQPYVIGQNDVDVAPDSTFRRDREMIVVFLIYSPTVSADKKFDVQVDYHVFRRTGPAEPADDGGGDHPPARRGERYVSHTAPQRFNPASMGSPVDPAAGQPLLAGQGILLSSFQEGEYRIGITVTDLLSRKTLLRDVAFTVVGS
jgi:hypothetical protein